MFNTYRIGGGDSHHRHTVTENRAPTDESVRLLSEMEAAAEKRVIERGRLENSTLDVHWVMMCDNYSDNYHLHLRFLLNGKEHKSEIVEPMHCFRSPKDRVMRIHEKVTKVIAEAITTGLIEKEGPALIGRKF